MSRKPGFLGFLFGGKKAEPVQGLPYRLRDDFLSDAEYSFWGVLRQVFGDRYYICPKISLKDIFFVVQPNENMSYYNKIDRKHVDFLLYDVKTRKPVLGIELDDKSHSRSDREQRDVFVNEVFAAAGLPLARVAADAAYNITDLKKYLEERLPEQSQLQNDRIQPDAAGETAATMETVKKIICPKCGILMVMRTSKRGKFYGCQNYPRCKETRNIIMNNNQ